MACGCGSKKTKAMQKPYDVMGGYKNLTQNQINKRLEVFKRIYCKSCQGRYNCNFESALTRFTIYSFKNFQSLINLVLS
jgi:hypothetical protein